MRPLKSLVKKAEYNYDALRAVVALRKFWRRHETFKVCIFELNRKNGFRCGYLSLFQSDMRYAQLELVGVEDRPQKLFKMQTMESRIERKLAEFDYLELEREFYDMYELYQSNGITERVNIREFLLQGFNKPKGDFGYECTNSFLSQKELQEDDFMLLKYQDFERLLIFDRQEHHYVGEQGLNFNKRLFLRFQNLIMGAVVHMDKNAPGVFGVIKPIRRPKWQPKIQENDSKNSDVFDPKNAVVAFTMEQGHVDLTQREHAKQEEEETSFDFHDILNCDFKRGSIVINLYLQDIKTLRSQLLGLFI